MEKDGLIRDFKSKQLKINAMTNEVKVNSYLKSEQMDLQNVFKLLKIFTQVVLPILYCTFVAGYFINGLTNK